MSEANQNPPLGSALDAATKDELLHLLKYILGHQHPSTNKGLLLELHYKRQRDCLAEMEAALAVCRRTTGKPWAAAQARWTKANARLDVLQNTKL